MLFKHTKPFDGCDEYMFEGQVSIIEFWSDRKIIHTWHLTKHILGSFTKDLCCDRYAMYPCNVVWQTVVHNFVWETP